MGTVFGSIELSKLDHWNLEFGGRNREIEMEPWIWSNPEHHCIEACRHGPCSTFFSEPCSAPLYVVVTRKHKVWYASSWLLLQMMNLPSLSPTFSQRQRHFEANNHHIFFIQISVLSPLSSPIFGPNVHQHLRVTASWAASFAVTGSCSPAISAAADPPMVSSLRSRTRSCQRAKGGKPGGGNRARNRAIYGAVQLDSHMSRAALSLPHPPIRGGLSRWIWGKVERRWWIKMDRMMYFLSWRLKDCGWLLQSWYVDEIFTLLVSDFCW